MKPARSAVDLPTVADPHDKDADIAVLYAGYNAPVADVVFPELPQVGASEGFSDAARIVEASETTVKKGQDALGDLVVKLPEIPLSQARELNPPGHIASSAF